MTTFEEVEKHLTDLEIIAETLEPTRRDAFLDMIDSFEASIKTLLEDCDGKDEDVDGANYQREQDKEEQEAKDHDSRLEDRANEN